ncbi:hypothetical protein N7454_003338 [Penicillium verhagenii]|nr:hypothetical protein N7454_003338 [Penicillium verhagenii]
MERAQLSKSSFFAALERLDHLEDTDDEEENSFERFAARKPSKIPIPPAAAATVSLSQKPPVLVRANTDPKPSSSDKPEESKAETGIKNPRRFEQSNSPGVRTLERVSTTGSMPDTRSGGPVSKKRKPNKNTKVVPEDQQIFKDLVFFFFPNSDTSPPRRLRIQRAQEYGAQWAREGSDRVTHVIVDKSLSYQDLLTHLKLDTFPKNVIIVNEVYPSDCIKFSSVLSPHYGRFCVEGTPVATAKKIPVAPEASPAEAESESADSLPHSQEDVQRNVGPALTVTPSEPVQDSAPNIAHNPEPRERDALDDIIDESKATSHLPLDSFDSPDEDTDGSDNESTASESDRARKTPKAPRMERTESWAKSIACMQKFDPGTRNNSVNNKTIEILQQIQTEKIVTRKQAQAIPGIGERLADKIEEIVLTNRLRQYDNTNYTAEDRILQEFLGVYGAGLSQASKWLAQGYRTLNDLLERAPLSTNQRIGVEHYNDFMQRIPRKEVEAHGAIVRKAVQSVDCDMQVIIAGSYRRGALNSGDVDVLITKPTATLEQIRCLMTDTVIPQLFKDGFLQAGLATSKKHDHDGSKWHGASSLLVAQSGGALIYSFMRLLARKKGLCLNQRGLYANVLRDAQQVKINPGQLLESRDERRIFALLEVPWRPAEQRIC